MSDPNRPRQSPSGSQHWRQDDGSNRSRRGSQVSSRSHDDSGGERIGAPRTHLPSRDMNASPPVRESNRDNGRDSRRDDRRRGGGRSRAGSGDGWGDDPRRDDARRERDDRGDGRRSRGGHSRDGWDDGRGGGWDDEPARPARRHGSSAGRRGESRGGPRGWDDGDWADNGAEDSWDRQAWGDDGQDAGGRHGSRGRAADSDVWQPASQREGLGGQRRNMAARAGAAWRSATAEVASAIKRPNSLPGRLMEKLRTDKKARIISIIVLVIVLVGLIPTPVLAYANTMSVAKDGIAHLKNAEADFKLLASSPTDLTLINNAQSELQASHNDFAQLQWRVALLSPAGALPKVGSKVSGVTKLVPLAAEGTQAGVVACDALKILVGGVKDPLGTSGGLTSAQTDQITSDMDQIKSLFAQMAPTLASLSQSDLSLDPGLWPTVSSLQARLPQVTQLMTDLDGMAHALPQLLGVGKPATYLMLVLDSSELRPTGGFIGNFGALTLDGGHLTSGIHISDITLIDGSVKFPQGYGPGEVPYTHSQIPIPDKYSWLKTVFAHPDSASWSLRDSNLDPDYPTTAQYALTLYPELLPDAQLNLQAQGSNLQLYDPSKSGQFAGVITLSLDFFQQALAITGPIHVVDHSINETVNAQNFVDKIHEYALSIGQTTGPDSVPCGDTSCAKVFTSDVVKAFMAQVKANSAQYFGKLAKLAYDSLHTKDIEVYLTPQAAQQTLVDLNSASMVEAPKTGDTVFEVESNIGANKDNYYLNYQMSDQVNISQSGDVTHKLGWNYRWKDNYPDPSIVFPAGYPDYHSYSRIYVPANADYLSQNGLQSFGTDNPSADTFGLKTFHGTVIAPFPYGGSTGPYGFGASWKVPGVVTQDSAGYHYTLLFQREAGILWPLTVTVTLPSCVSTATPPTTSGLDTTATVTVKGNVVTITGPLTQNEKYTFNWTC